MVRAVVRRSGTAVCRVAPFAAVFAVAAVLAGILASGAALALEPAVADGVARFAAMARAASQEAIVPGKEKTVAAAVPVPARKPVTDAMPPVASGKSAAVAAAPAPSAVEYQAVEFATLPGWAEDDHLAALKAFATSCQRIQAAARAGNKAGATPTPPALLVICAQAGELLAKAATRNKAKAFFEQHFTPHRVVHTAASGLLTGYYEPVIAGARQPSADYAAPIYRRPVDLVNLVSEAERGAKAEQLTHARKTGNGVEPFPTRQQIESGALAGQGLEILYLKDPVEVFFMQVQGSGRIELADGTSVRVTYDGKNGHAYSSIGKYLIDKGLVPADKMSLQALKAWLRSNPQQMREVLWQNKSYVFFRELAGEEAEGPLGVLEIPLTPGRSLALDTAFHAIGSPVYVAAPTLKHATGREGGFNRLMIAQDVGSAIRGPERGDIYFGSGHEAGSIAGVTKHPGNFYVLLPREAERGTIIEADVGATAERGAVRQASQ
jgi:membrane-bound lytic murein transglycosylase A